MTRGSSPDQNLELRAQMSGVYAVIESLYRYIWSDKDLNNTVNRKQVLHTIDRLSSKFETIKQKTSDFQKEPGFKAALDANLLLLKNAKEGFDDDTSDEIKMRLKSITSNCIACHTKERSNKVYLGSFPKIKYDTLANRLAVAEFLIATRQFKKGQIYLESLIDDFIRSGDTDNYKMWYGIKLYLLTTARAQGKYLEASRWIRDTASRINLKRWEIDRMMIWSKDLSGFELPQEPSMLLEKSKNILNEVQGFQTDKQKEDRFVRTLLVTGMLHQYLDGQINEIDRKHATFLLAKAYFNLPCEIFESYPEMFLFQVIKTYPHTKESQESFDMLNYYFSQSQSEGLLIEEDLETMENLKNEAF